MIHHEPTLDLELDEGEEVICITRRHWIVLIQRSFALVMIGLTAGLLAFYRAIGGTFIQDSVNTPGTMDIFNVGLLLLVAVLVVLWARGLVKGWVTGLLYLLAVGVLMVAFFFRLQGGRIFYIDPLSQGGNDALNLGLILLAIIVLAALVYVYDDWANDFLTLTNLRVLYEDQDEIPFLRINLRHVLQQMLIEDIQQVNLRQESYIEFWLHRIFGMERYGAIVIRSFSPRRLVFEYAANPAAMEKEISKRVNAVRQREGPEMLRRLIEDQVYGNKPERKRRRTVQITEQRAAIPWLFAPNPEIRNDANETMIWRPSWLYTTIQMYRPLAMLLLTPLLFVLISQLGFLNASLAFLLWLPVALFSFGWAWWIYDSHVHDLYILTRQDITDVDKRPFGPESRRRAPLSAIQDIVFDVDFIESQLGYGTITIETGGGSGGGKFTFKHVPNPRDVQATINDYLTDFRRREKEGQLQESLALLKHYHEAQSAHGEVVEREQLIQQIVNRVSETLPRTPEPVPQSEQDELTALYRVRREARLAARAELWRALRRGRRRRS